MHIDFVYALVVGFVFNVLFHCELCEIVYINTQYFYIQNQSLEVAHARQNNMGTVLVVDDDRRVAKLITEVLSARGIEVSSCEDGSKACKILSHENFRKNIPGRLG